eukprot:7125749-Prymnesium_polylepis.1
MCTSATHRTPHALRAPAPTPAEAFVDKGGGQHAPILGHLFRMAAAVTSPYPLVCPMLVRRRGHKPPSSRPAV